jgi:hypothetical protein
MQSSLEINGTNPPKLEKVTSLLETETLFNCAVSFISTPRYAVLLGQ